LVVGVFHLVGSKSFIFALLSILFVVSACTSTPLAERFSCANSDWYEIGRRDGASGASTDRINGYLEKCGHRLEPESEDMYINGRNAGLVEYCTGKNGFELGRMNVTYNHVCPTTMEKDFVAAFERGTRARTLELENKKLENRIEQLAAELSGSRSIASENKDAIAEELKFLKGKRAANEQELTKIAK
jgi:hypothetical protein